MDTLCTVTGCAKPVQDAHVCSSCAYELDAALAELLGTPDLPGLAADLDITISKQDRITVGNGRGNSEHPLPLNLGASDVAGELRSTLTTWALLVAFETRTPAPAPDIPTTARWLRPRVGWLRHHTAGADAVQEITTAVAAARRTVDRPPTLWYLGPCNALYDAGADCDCACHIGGAYRPACDTPGGCGTRHTTINCDGEIYAHPGAVGAVCRTCRTTHDVTSRRAELFAAINDMLATATALSRLITYLGFSIADSTIRGYASRGRIVAHGHAGTHPTYRLGDVVDVYMSNAAKTSNGRKAA